MAKSDSTLALEQLRQQIISDAVAPELAATATQLVFGEGNPHAEIVFVGEAPGKNEDLQGKPFVGAAGKFLDEMLESIGLERQDVYITNIVKYRPPNNRDPLPTEKEAFLPYLQAQLAIIRPKLVVTLGRHSLNCFLPGLQISAVHGQPKPIRLKMDNFVQGYAEEEQQSIVILPLFHPAAALYNGGLRQTLLNDFKTLPTVLKQM